MSSCIWLFWTCWTSTWRDIFIQKYTQLWISYYNPQVLIWNPENSKIEAEHLANDEIILFPITDETYWLWSLSEVGFSILNAINLNQDRFIVIFIDENISQELQETSQEKSVESLKSRRLVKEHLQKSNFKNVFIVSSLHEMLKTSLVLYEVLIKLEWLHNKYHI